MNPFYFQAHVTGIGKTNLCDFMSSNDRSRSMMLYDMHISLLVSNQINYIYIQMDFLILLCVKEIGGFCFMTSEIVVSFLCFGFLFDYVLTLYSKDAVSYLEDFDFWEGSLNWMRSSPPFYVLM